MIKQEPVGPAPCARLSASRVQGPRGPMEIRLTLRPGMSGTKKLLARYGERLVCVRYRYDRATGKRVKTAELIVEDVAWAGRARKPRRNDRDLVGVRIGWKESELRAAVKRARHLEAATAVMGTLLGRSPH